jgi:hypothetical protein
MDCPVTRAGQLDGGGYRLAGVLGPVDGEQDILKHPAASARESPGGGDYHTGIIWSKGLASLWLCTGHGRPPGARVPPRPDGHCRRVDPRRRPWGIGQQTLTGRVSLVVFAAALAMVQPSG